MRYLVAVSGGIDSVVLLDILAKNRNHELIVAHFDHGIRSDSADDARFVAGLAAKYHLPFVMKREELGIEAGEDKARSRRYDFLRSEAIKQNATIVTAHHQDDVIESIAINLVRGTGWRGLAVLGAADIKRPLLHYSKRDIREFAHARRLEWVEDSTNASSKYLRNRLRWQIKACLAESDKQVLAAMRWHQIKLRNQIDEELKSYIYKDEKYSRYLLIMIDKAVAIELLRAMIGAKSGWTPTRPQAERALVAIKTAHPGSIYEVGSQVSLRFMANTFIVGTP